MQKYFTLVILCIVLMAAACKKEDTLPDPNFFTPVAPLNPKGPGVVTPLTGNWDWIKAINSTFGDSTPGSTGIDEKLVFGTDSTMTIYHNSLYYYQFKYTYVSNYKFNGQTFDVAIIGDSKYQTVIKNDTLTLSTFEYGNRDQRIYVKLK